MSEIAIASPMLPPSLVLTGSLEEHSAFLETNSFDGGLELHPMRFTRLSRDLARLAVDGPSDEADFVFQSGHQSYVSMADDMMRHDTLSEIIRHGQAITTFHPATKSLQVIGEYQSATRKRALPVTVYPEIGLASGFQNLDYSDVLFQPNVRNLKKYNVATTEDLLSTASADGMTGVTWDGYHYQRTAKDGTTMEDWREALPAMLESTALTVKAVHVSIGRTDRSEDDGLLAATTDELDVFMNHPSDIKDTTTGEMIRMIHQSKAGAMRYVLEALPPKDVPREIGLRLLATNLRVYLDTL